MSDVIQLLPDSVANQIGRGEEYLGGCRGCRQN